MYYTFFIHPSINGQDLDVYHWEKNQPGTFCGFEPRVWQVARFVVRELGLGKLLKLSPTDGKLEEFILVGRWK